MRPFYVLPLAFLPAIATTAVTDDKINVTKNLDPVHFGLENYCHVLCKRGERDADLPNGIHIVCPPCPTNWEADLALTQAYRDSEWGPLTGLSKAATATPAPPSIPGFDWETTISQDRMTAVVTSRPLSVTPETTSVSTAPRVTSTSAEPPTSTQPMRWDSNGPAPFKPLFPIEPPTPIEPIGPIEPPTSVEPGPSSGSAPPLKSSRRTFMESAHGMRENHGFSITAKSTLSTQYLNIATSTAASGPTSMASEDFDYVEGANTTDVNPMDPDEKEEYLSWIGTKDLTLQERDGDPAKASWPSFACAVALWCCLYPRAIRYPVALVPPECMSKRIWHNKTMEARAACAYEKLSKYADFKVAFRISPREVTGPSSLNWPALKQFRKKQDTCGEHLAWCVGWAEKQLDYPAAMKDCTDRLLEDASQDFLVEVLPRTNGLIKYSDLVD